MIVIAGFPGTGKSVATKKLKELSDKHNLNLKIADSDSSQFSWLDEEHTNRNPDFKYDYIEHIEKLIEEDYDIIFVSTHNGFLRSLADILCNVYGMPTYIAVPYSNYKKIYKQRYIDRGNTTEFVDNIMNNWNTYISDLENIGMLPYVCTIHCCDGYLTDHIMLNIDAYDKVSIEINQ